MRAIDDVEDVYPLSPLQQGMLFHVLADADAHAYVNQTRVRIVGDLDVASFVSAWEVLVDRHPTLRSAFVWDGLDAPLQVVRREAELRWTVLDWSDDAPERRERLLEEMIERDREDGIDIVAAPLMRMSLVRLAPEEWEWVWTCHHLIADAWSVQVLLSELRASYEAALAGAAAALPDAPPYRDFIARVTTSDLSMSEAFWTATLEGFTSPHRLEVPGLPPEGGRRGHASFEVEVDADVAERLRRMAASSRITFNTAVLGAWALLLSRWTLERDVVFGSTSSGRDPSVAGSDAAVGLFINTLPVRVDVDPSARLTAWLERLQADHVRVRLHEQTPLASIQRWSDIPPGEALFESIFVFESLAQGTPDAFDEGRVQFSRVGFSEHSNYPLAVIVAPGPPLTIRFVYDRTRFSDVAVERLAEQLSVLLDQFGVHPELPLARFDLVSGTESVRLARLDEGPLLASDGRMAHRIIEDVARTNPDRVAVVFEGQHVTYTELDRRANAVAYELVSKGVVPGTLVATLMDRSIEMIVAIVGVLKAGAGYVPLDPAYPEAHIAAMLDDADIDVMITRDGATSPGLDVATVVTLDPAAAPSSDHAPRVASDDSLPAYVIHTSGSTGRPKGVTVTHRNLVQSTTARPQHYGAPVGRFLLLSSFSFDSSIAGIFWTLFTGGTLVLPPPGLEHDVDALVGLMQRERITHLLCLPALYRLLVEAIPETEAVTLEVAIVAGEASPPDLLDVHMARLPGVELHNEYGPTEATVWCTVHRATEVDRGRSLPIGRPIAGARVHVVDRHGNPTPSGFAGELCVAGEGVTSGYLHRPDLTAERFTTLHLRGATERVYRTGDLAAYSGDGPLLFLGRLDEQLKIRGHRIETSAVEHALLSLPSVRECVVSGMRADGRDTMQLVAHVVPADGEALDIDGLRREVAAVLPPFMVPDQIVAIGDLPRLPNGKVDHRALPTPRRSRQHTADEGVEPRNDAERKLAEIWSDLLGIDRVGVHDDFFALGGDSIVSIQMISRARQAGVHVKPGQVSTHPTIAALAAVAQVTDGNLHDQETISGDVDLAPIQTWFLESRLGHRDQWNQSVQLVVPKDLDTDALASALRALIDHHDMLRARFTEKGGVWRQYLEPAADVPIDAIEVDAQEVHGVVREAQTGLDLSDGPLVRALLVRVRGASSDLLLVVAHHLVVDIVSWTILLDDLELAYAQASSGAPIALPPKTSSYRDWTRYLRSADRSMERAHWIAAGIDDADHHDGTVSPAGPEGSTERLVIELDADTSERFLTTAHEAFRTRPEDLLVAAVGRAVAQWTGSEVGRLTLETHGRRNDIDGLDVTRTVGWFTSHYPIRVHAGPDPGSALTSVKETLRTTPGGGTGYLALRHLDHDEDIRSQRQPDLIVNYLGRALERPRDAVFSLVPEEPVGSRHADDDRLFPIEVVASVVGGTLVIECRYSPSAHDRATMSRLVDGIHSSLVTLIDHCCDVGTGGFTPSDFPEAGLDQGALDEFLEGL